MPVCRSHASGDNLTHPEHVIALHHPLPPPLAPLLAPVHVNLSARPYTYPRFHCPLLPAGVFWSASATQGSFWRTDVRGAQPTVTNVTQRGAAIRLAPLTARSRFLALHRDGNLVLYDGVSGGQLAELQVGWDEGCVQLVERRGAVIWYCPLTASCASATSAGRHPALPHRLSCSSFPVLPDWSAPCHITYTPPHPLHHRLPPAPPLPPQLNASGFPANQTSPALMVDDAERLVFVAETAAATVHVVEVVAPATGAPSLALRRSLVVGGTPTAMALAYMPGVNTLDP